MSLADKLFYAQWTDPEKEESNQAKSETKEKCVYFLI